MGIELFSLMPSQVSRRGLVETILMTPGLTTKPI